MVLTVSETYQRGCEREGLETWGLEESSRGLGGISGAQKCNQIVVWLLGRTKVCFTEAGWHGMVGTAQLQPCILALMLVWINQGEVLPDEYSQQGEWGNGPQNQTQGKKVWVEGDWITGLEIPVEVKLLSESELTETSQERSEILVGCSKLRWWKRWNCYHHSLDCRAVPSSWDAKPLGEGREGGSRGKG